MRLGVEYRGDKPHVGGYSLQIIGAIVGVVVVVALGKWLAKRNAEADTAPAKADGTGS
jgi:hypothetical protein